MDIKQLETWLWEAACSLRGSLDAPKFKDYILPLIFVRRLSDVFDDEIERLAKEFAALLGCYVELLGWPALFQACRRQAEQRYDGRVAGIMQSVVNFLAEKG